MAIFALQNEWFMSYQQPKIALVHDDFMQAGGAESLFATIAKLFPKAPIYTSLVDWNKIPQSINIERIKTSYMQKIPFAKIFYKALLPLYPLAFESFDFKNYDVVLTSTTRFANSIITRPQTIHICYINSTPRFLWDENVKGEYIPRYLSPFASPLISHLKRWDKAASSRPDFYIANSQNVAAKVKKYYNRDSEVIYPFADIDFFDIAKVSNWKLKSQKYFLVVSRLVKWKKIEIAILACQSLGVNLKVVGTGADEKRLKKFAHKYSSSESEGRVEKLKKGSSRQARTINSSVEFLGKVTREELRELYQNAEAVIVTQQEDFGIAAVESQACGTPVLAYDAGGQQEIVVNGKTGLLYKNQTKESLKDAINAFHAVKWEKSACRRNSLKFSQASFVKKIKSIVNEYGRKTP